MNRAEMPLAIPPYRLGHTAVWCDTAGLYMRSLNWHDSRGDASPSLILRAESTIGRMNWGARLRSENHRLKGGGYGNGLEVLFRPEAGPAAEHRRLER
jgi:hypothetical protein